MYFISLCIKNVKCFSDEQQLDLTDGSGALSRWTLILGDNGIGKTTLLKSLVWMTPVKKPPRILEEYSGGSENVSNDSAPNEHVQIKPLMDDFEGESIFEQVIRVGENVKTYIKGTFSNGVELGEIPNEQQTVSVAMNFERKDGKLEDISIDYGELKSFNSPNLFAYSASRHMALKNFDKSEIRDPLSNLFSLSGDLYDAEQVLSNLNYASIKEKVDNLESKTFNYGKTTQLLEKIKSILKDLLPEVTSGDDIVILSPFDKNGEINTKLVELKTPYGNVQLSELSLGYKTMLAWAVDLAIRMFWKNPESENPLSEPAVVIVDEIDLHLHPKWQRTLRDYLTKHFSNTQFICTAHSPFVAQSSDRDNLCVLTSVGNEVIIENNPAIVRGWKIGQIVTSDLFDVPERSVEFDRLTHRRRELLDKGQLTIEEAQELKKLDNQLKTFPTDDQVDQEILEQIRISAETLRIKGILT